MPDTVADLLRELRRARGFVADEVADSKVGRLVGWFEAQDRDAAVVGLSGGVDSAVTVGLLAAAAARPDSPLRRVVALALPIDGEGATGQDQAAKAAGRVADALGVELWTAPLAAAHRSYLDTLARAAGLAFDPWSAGQLLAVERTPALYGAAALLQSHGLRSVVVGTTNRDEGAYLGFFGKASDAMVDLQPISDLHKSEVRRLAVLLGVPADVIAATPRGDVWDGRSDEEMIGATYDEVETVLRLHELSRSIEVVAHGLTDGDQLLAAAEAVETHHRHNRHKYAVGSPATHLDVLPRGVPGGWSDTALSGRGERAPADTPGSWRPPSIALDPLGPLPDLRREGLVTIGRGVLTLADCARMVTTMGSAEPEPVGVTGVRDDGHVGSWRATAFDEGLTRALWSRLAPLVPSVRFLGPCDPTDAHATDDRTGHRTWRAVGLSPLLRFMRYEPGGRHLTHYDAAFDYGDGRRTLSSVVLYLTGSDAETGCGGATRFVTDGQGHLPTAERDHRDWDRDTRPDEVLLAVRPEVGSAIVFDHRLGHDVERWNGPGSRVVVRADVVYEAVPDGRDTTDAPGRDAPSLTGRPDYA